MPATKMKMTIPPTVSLPARLITRTNMAPSPAVPKQNNSTRRRKWSSTQKNKQKKMETEAVKDQELEEAKQLLLREKDKRKQEGKEAKKRQGRDMAVTDKLLANLEGQITKDRRKTDEEEKEAKLQEEMKQKSQENKQGEIRKISTTTSKVFICALVALQCEWAIYLSRTLLMSFSM